MGSNPSPLTSHPLSTSTVDTAYAITVNHVSTSDHHDGPGAGAAVLDIRLPVDPAESSPCELDGGRVSGIGLPASPGQSPFRQGGELPRKGSLQSDANKRGGSGGKGSGKGVRLLLPRRWQAAPFLLPPRWLRGYLRKFRGIGEGLFPAYPSFIVVFWSFVASFTGISLCAFLAFNTSMQQTLSPQTNGSGSTSSTSSTSSSSGSSENGQPQQQEAVASFMIGSFGATAVLIFGTIDSPLSQPRNVILGSGVSAIIGVFIAEIFSIGGLAFPNTSWLWLQCGLAVSLSIVAMQLLRIVHPPGGASALIAVMSPPSLRCHGLFVLTPVLLGVLIMLTVALFINNIARQYPLYWWRPVVLDIPVPEGSTHHSAVTAGEAYHTIQHMHVVHSPVRSRVHAAPQPPMHHPGRPSTDGHRAAAAAATAPGEAYHTVQHMHAVHSPVHPATHQWLPLLQPSADTHSATAAATAGEACHTAQPMPTVPSPPAHAMLGASDLNIQESAIRAFESTQKRIPAHAMCGGSDMETEEPAARVHGGNSFLLNLSAGRSGSRSAVKATAGRSTEVFSAEQAFVGGPFRHVSISPLSQQRKHHGQQEKQQVQQQRQRFPAGTANFSCCSTLLDVDATSSHPSLTDDVTTDDRAVDDRSGHISRHDNNAADIEECGAQEVDQSATNDRPAIAASRSVDLPAALDPAAGIDAAPIFEEPPDSARAQADSARCVTDSAHDTPTDSPSAVAESANVTADSAHVPATSGVHSDPSHYLLDTGFMPPFGIVSSEGLVEGTIGDRQTQDNLDNL
ncbi:hypothetical protein CLOM_g13872 [Closterium sp. NIES-68]|nr:hypothetical protein CLOM_g13872 [Closterium sp. NIES-68]GJP71026.1 hypothetical protein CLOP_g1905 [Closterium sp. NIES-67]